MHAGAIPEVNTLPNRLRIAREYAGLSMLELAKMTGLNRNTIAQAEKNMHTPNNSTITAIAYACGVNREWLTFGKVKDPEPEGPGLLARHEGFEPPTF